LKVSDAANINFRDFIYVESGEGIESIGSSHHTGGRNNQEWNPEKELKEVHNSKRGKTSRAKVESGEGIERLMCAQF